MRIKDIILQRNPPRFKGVMWAQPTDKGAILRLWNGGDWEPINGGGSSSDSGCNCNDNEEISLDIEKGAYVIDSSSTLDQLLLYTQVNIIFKELGIDTSNFDPANPETFFNSLTPEQQASIMQMQDDVDVLLSKANDYVNSMSFGVEGHGMATLNEPFDIGKITNGETTAIDLTCVDGTEVSISFEGTTINAPESPILVLTTTTTLEDIDAAINANKKLTSEKHGDVIQQADKQDGLYFRFSDGYIYKYSAGLENLTSCSVYPPAAEYRIVPYGLDTYRICSLMNDNTEYGLKNIVDYTDTLYMPADTVATINNAFTDSLIFHLGSVDGNTATKWYAIAHTGNYEGGQYIIRSSLFILRTSSSGNEVNLTIVEQPLEDSPYYEQPQIG